MDTDHWIDLMKLYPKGTLVRFIGGAMIFEDPITGKDARPIGGPDE